MPRRRIFSVGFVFPSESVEEIPFNSDRSLLDADIVLFQPTLGKYDTSTYYRGKPRLEEFSSFDVKRRIAHWRAELKAAVEAGRMVVIYLAKPQEVYLDTGDRSYSGTGRNRQTTVIVAPASSYDALPLAISVTATSGTAIVPARDLSYFAPYWKEFGEVSHYQVTVEGTFDEVLLHTAVGRRVVAAVVRFSASAMMLIPPVAYDIDAFTAPQGSDTDVANGGDDEEEGCPSWTPEAIAFGNRLIQALVAVADGYKSAGEITPPPEWTRVAEYRLPGEDILEKAIHDKGAEIARLRAEETTLQSKLKDAGALRRLLFAKGKELERAVIEALRLFGFDVTAAVEETAEFDVVFTALGERILGEAEGKDDRAVNIDKLSQLERHLQEDFAEENVTNYAKGVLFGNPFRLLPVAERAQAFTEKCLIGAKRAGIALLRTPDLFFPVKYLKGTEDSKYAQSCRNALLQAEGTIVVFPAPPLETRSYAERK